MREKAAGMEYSGRDNLDIMKLASKYNNAIFAWLQTDQYETILDFGAGNGEFCNRVEPHCIDAVEVDQALSSQITCPVYTSLDHIKDETYEMVYTLNVLEHIEDDAEIVVQLVSKLKRGGVLKVLVPAHMMLFSEMDRKVGHYRRYSIERLRDIVSQADMDVVACRYFDFLGYFATLLYKTIDNSGTINPSGLVAYDSMVFPASRLLDKVTFGTITGKNIMLVARKR